LLILYRKIGDQVRDDGGIFIRQQYPK
jgi:hypothetical protein